MAGEHNPGQPQEMWIPDSLWLREDPVTGQMVFCPFTKRARLKR